MRAALSISVLLSACSVGEVGPGSGDPSPDAQLPDPDPPAGGAGTLQVTATTTTNNDQYAPRNCSVVWVESGGTFIKTIDRKCDVRRQHLVAWRAAAGTADVDAVTGATRSNHTAPLSITWDLEDRTGNVVADGTYTIRMETTELNATQAAQNHQGSFTFVKGATAEMQSNLSNGGFNVTLDFTP